MRFPRLFGYESEIRFFVLLLAVFVIISPWGTIYLVYRTKMLLSREFDEVLVSVAGLAELEISPAKLELIADRSLASEEYFSLQLSLRRLALNPGIDRVFFADREGKVLIASHVRDTYSKDVFAEMAPVVFPSSPSLVSWRSEERSLRSYLMPIEGEGGVLSLLVVQKESGYLDLIDRLARFDMWMKIGGFGALLFLGLLFVRLVLRPYRKIKETAREIGKVRRGEDETEFMVRTFRESVEKLRELASLGEMSAGVAHEFRNSMGTIIGYAQLLKRGEVGVVDKLLTECRRFNSVLEVFLRFARPTELKLEPIDLRAVLEEVVSSSNTKLQISLNFEERVPLVKGDRLLLRQAFSNIIQNSIEASPEGGSLTITAKRAGGKVEIGFKDTGRGISKTDLGRVFTPFFSTKEDGVGLGLSLVYKIITAHGGRVRIRSEERKGTEVVVEFS